MRPIRYREIAESLRQSITAEGLVAGALLPSEAQLAETHGASRVTVRKALEVLRTDGLVDSRQGFGWFVAGDRLRQSLGALATIEGQLEAQGRAPERRVLAFGFPAPPDDVRALLGTEDVLRVVRVNLADGQPFAVVTVWCPASIGAGLSRDDVASAPFAELLDVRLASASQTIGAAAAESSDAERLGVPVGSPLLVCERISRDGDGTVVLVSEHRFPGHLTEFVVDLPGVGSNRDGDPEGLRLVEGVDRQA